MKLRNTSPTPLRTEAIVRRVDLVNRELDATIDGLPVTVYVPPDCDVFLRGERVKLRMVQPGDRLRISYSALADSLVARAIEVQPAYPSAALSI